MLNYLINAVAIAYALLGLAKDWKAHQTTSRRILGLLLLLCAGIGAEINAYLTSRSTDQLSRQLADIGEKASRLEAQLESTRNALDAPKAEIEGSLGDVGFDMENIERKDAYVEQRADGSVKFVVTVANKSKVQAKNGAIYLRICAKCEFVDVPADFHKAPDSIDQDMSRPFARMDPHTGQSIRLQVKPPEGSRQFMLSVTSPCENCMFRRNDELYVHY
jgi:hypothetical protein